MRRRSVLNVAFIAIKPQIVSKADLTFESYYPSTLTTESEAPFKIGDVLVP